MAQLNLAEGVDEGRFVLLRLSLSRELMMGARYARVFPLPVSAARPTERPSRMGFEESS